MADQVLENLTKLQSGMDTMTTRMDAMAEEMTALRRGLGMVQQDTTLIRGVLSGHTRVLDILQQDRRMVRGAVNDVARESVTPREVEAIHHDLNRVQRDIAEFAGRLEIVEGRNRN